MVSSEANCLQTKAKALETFIVLILTLSHETYSLATFKSLKLKWSMWIIFTELSFFPVPVHLGHQNTRCKSGPNTLL
ncbi:hypothetical protein BpHYR1_043062 [Brachionus plicatilis]|uniref:Uncharacterized protein n=1 Tax=Brachionus plicatilis TaxID=10195 RepID=A0A3M7RFH7_BRAPC|nr:hypothetical protein BpHYR1_043062 [Brachionus plicatilis]